MMGEFVQAFRYFETTAPSMRRSATGCPLPLASTSRASRRSATTTSRMPTDAAALYGPVRGAGRANPHGVGLLGVGRYSAA